MVKLAMSLVYSQEIQVHQSTVMNRKLNRLLSGQSDMQLALSQLKEGGFHTPASQEGKQAEITVYRADCLPQLHARYCVILLSKLTCS